MENKESKIHIINLIHIYSELNLDQEFIEKVEISLTKDFNNVSLWIEICATLRIINKFHAAFETYEKALQLFPDNPILYNNKSLLLSEWGRYEEAYFALEKAIQLKPDYVNAYSNMGRLFEKLHRFDQAIIYYEKSLSIDPNCLLALNNMGLCFKGLGEKTKAKEMYQAALFLDPTYPDSLFNLAGMYLEDQDYEAAEALIDKLLQIHPSDQGAIEIKKMITDKSFPADFKLGLPPINENKILIRASLNYNHKGQVIKPNLTPNGELIISMKDFEKYDKNDLVSRVGFKAYEQHELWKNVQVNIQKIIDGEIAEKDFFISYRWHNQETEIFVENLVIDLINRGYSVLYDRHEIQKNPEIDAVDFISKACSCSYAICILTKEYRSLVERFEAVNAIEIHKDGWLIDEWELLKHHANYGILKLIGVWLSDIVVPIPFTKETCLDFRNQENYLSNLNAHFPERKFMVTGIRNDKTGRTIGGISKSEINKAVERLISAGGFEEIIVHY